MDGGAVRAADGSRLTPGAAPGTGPVVFFDGHCGLCNAFVDFVIARDHAARFRFAPLQGETAARRLSSDDTARPDSGGVASPDVSRSVVLLEAGVVHRRSEAALRVVAGLGGAWRLVTVLRVVPRPLRDFIYDFIARRRYRWFGRRAACRMPAPGERGRFLP